MIFSGPEVILKAKRKVGLLNKSYWNVVVLYLQEYGGLEYCPDTITAKILEMDARSQSEVSLEYRSLVFVCKYFYQGLAARNPWLAWTNGYEVP